MTPDFIVTAFVTLFVIIDPLGLAPIFLSLTEGQGDAERRRIAVRAIAIAAIVLIIFALVGEIVLSALGISLPAFRIAGGLLLFWIAFEMLFERRDERKADNAARAQADTVPHDVAAFPLAVPLIAGPGAVTAAILLTGQVEGSWLALATVLAIIVIVLAVNLVVLLAAVPINRLLGLTIRTVVSRLLGLILAALAVQFVADGVRALI